jgi:nucleoside-diphosphate-sugar epimerase
MVHSHAEANVPQRVVVVGASGFVGGAVVRHLTAKGIPVLSVGRRDVDLLAVSAGEDLARLLLPTDAVVLAAAMAPCKSTAMLADNLAMVHAMVQALQLSAPSHVVNISSDAVYPDSPLPLSEQVQPAPDSLHGAMHLARELCLSAEVPAPIAHLRPTLIYGLDDPHNGYGPNRFRRQAAKAETITLFGEGEERRDHVWVEDVAELVLRVLQHGSTGALNIATGEVHSFRWAAELAVAAAQGPSKIIGSPRQGAMPHGGYRPFDPALTARLFPDFAYLSLPDGIAHVQDQSRG